MACLRVNRYTMQPPIVDTSLRTHGQVHKSQVRSLLSAQAATVSDIDTMELVSSFLLPFSIRTFDVLVWPKRAASWSAVEPQ